MEKLFTRKEAAKILGISIATLDTARNNGLISYVQYVQNGCVPQQWTDFLCSVCAKRLRLFHRREPSGVHRKIHASGEAGGKVCHIPQSAQRRSVSRSVSLPE